MSKSFLRPVYTSLPTPPSFHLLRDGIWREHATALLPGDFAAYSRQRPCMSSAVIHSPGKGRHGTAFTPGLGLTHTMQQSQLLPRWWSSSTEVSKLSEKAVTIYSLLPRVKQPHTATKGKSVVAKMIKHNLETLQVEVHIIFMCCEVLLIIFLIAFSQGP